MNKTALLILGLLLCAGLGFGLYSCAGADPLRDMKAGEVKELSDPAVRAVLDQALDLIQKDDMKALRKLMVNGDPMAFDENYRKYLFAQKDFCPAEVRTMRQIARGTVTFFQADVFSTGRKQLYCFTFENKKGAWKIGAIEAVGK